MSLKTICNLVWMGRVFLALCMTSLVLCGLFSTLMTDDPFLFTGLAIIPVACAGYSLFTAIFERHRKETVFLASLIKEWKNGMEVHVQKYCIPTSMVDVLGYNIYFQMSDGLEWFALYEFDTEATVLHCHKWKIVSSLLTDNNGGRTSIDLGVSRIDFINWLTRMVIYCIIQKYTKTLIDLERL